MGLYKELRFFLIIRYRYAPGMVRGQYVHISSNGLNLKISSRIQKLQLEGTKPV